MTKTNPFKFGSIVSGEFFYNREEELLRIVQTLAGGNNITLYAPRRYGKSSLVKKALKELHNQGFNTIYLDFMSIFRAKHLLPTMRMKLLTVRKTLLKILSKK